MLETKVLEVLENGRKNINKIATMTYAPVMPFVQSIVLELDYPVFFGRVESLENWIDFVHSAFMTGFYPTYIDNIPSETSVGTFHTAVFEYENAAKEIIKFDMFVPVAVIESAGDKGKVMFNHG